VRVGYGYIRRTTIVATQLNLEEAICFSEGVPLPGDVRRAPVVPVLPVNGRAG
jgi:hypothetical protein